jgi:hypothetical protein
LRIARPPQAQSLPLISRNPGMFRWQLADKNAMWRRWKLRLGQVASMWRSDRAAKMMTVAKTEKRMMNFIIRALPQALSDLTIFTS